MPAVQTVQYELKHTPSLLDATVQKTVQAAALRLKAGAEQRQMDMKPALLLRAAGFGSSASHNFIAQKQSPVQLRSV